MRPISTICMSLYSKAIGASAIRGERTLREGMAVKPASAISLTPAGKSTAQTFILSRIASLTMCTTNSGKIVTSQRNPAADDCSAEPGALQKSAPGRGRFFIGLPRQTMPQLR